MIFLRLLDEFVEAVGSGRGGGERDRFYWFLSVPSWSSVPRSITQRGRVRRRNETEHRVTNARLINHFGEKVGESGKQLFILKTSLFMRKYQWTFRLINLRYFWQGIKIVSLSVSVCLSVCHRQYFVRFRLCFECFRWLFTEKDFSPKCA